jgi:16S rRNA (guanine966-N2)-methyltransferase
MPQKRKRRSLEKVPPARPVTLRIVGGTLRGRTFRHTGTAGTRPMKDRVREAVFNLIGSLVKGALAIDLFAGTGALALEAISRGAAAAVAIERHFPSAQEIRQNATALGIDSQVDVVAADTFVWWPKSVLDTTRPWVVFCSPPFDFYIVRQAEMLELIRSLLARSPAHSLIVLESDLRFDTGLLPFPEQWDVRRYAPAMIAIYEKMTCTSVGADNMSQAR